jgi:two-component system LytT family response regulator
VTGPVPIRAFLVDDEPLALKRLARMLEATGRVTIVGRATDPEAGLRQIASQPVDVLFLDIQMPGLSGFEVVERVPAGPLVVFTTAHDRHAVQAFEVNAVDYLLKPVERERLHATLDRLAGRLADPAGGDVMAALAHLARDLRAGPLLDHVASRVRDRVQLIPVGEVTHLLARDRATYAVTPSAEHMLDMTLAELERRLDPARFFRIHRAILVNLAWVAELRADGGGHLTACLRDGRRTELPVSRDRARPLKERLGLV